MVRRALAICILLVLSALFVGVAAAAAKGGSNSFVNTCKGQPTSAINQYCEVVPSATGPTGTGPQTPELATTLPGGVAFRLLFNPATRRLPMLPASTRPPHGARGAGKQATSPGSTAGSASVSTGGFWLTIALVLGGIALMLIAAQQARRIRQRQRLASSAPR